MIKCLLYRRLWRCSIACCFERKLHPFHLLFNFRSNQTVRDLCYNNTELRNCSCSLAYITLDLEEIWRPIYSINCSNLNFFQLPSSVPENTTTFYAKNNHVRLVVSCSFINQSYNDNQITCVFYLTTRIFMQISNIEPIISSAYSSVQDIYLDHNEISSIEVLESDGWLERFRAFSLKGNLLNKVQPLAR